MQGKYAIVTGASSGIGYQYARELGLRGYGLVVVSNEPEALSEKLACRAVNAMFRGRARITPGFSSKLLVGLVRLIPTGVLKLVRRLLIF